MFAYCVALSNPESFLVIYLIALSRILTNMLNWKYNIDKASGYLKVRRYADIFNLNAILFNIKIIVIDKTRLLIYSN